MVPGHFAGAIQQYQGRRRRGSVDIEVVLAYGNGHIGQSAEAMTDGIDVLQLVARTRVFDLSRVSVITGRADDFQALGRKLGTQLGDDRRFCLAVRAPVSPEEKQDRGSPEFRLAGKGTSQRLLRLQCR